MKNRKGFTLVEMLIVIVIIGILAATIMPKLLGAQDRARDTGIKADMNQLNQALQSYAVDNMTFFPTDVTIKGCDDAALSDVSELSGALKPYMRSVPTKTPGNEPYKICKLGEGYVLQAKMETQGGGNSNTGVQHLLNGNKLKELEKPTDKENSFYLVWSE